MMTKQESEQVLLDAGMSQEKVDAFMAWHLLHSTAWEFYEQEMYERLHKPGRLSSKGVFEAIRRKMGGHGCRYSVNNNHTAAFARLFAAKYRCAHRFEFRRLGGFDAGQNRGDRYAA